MRTSYWTSHIVALNHTSTSKTSGISAVVVQGPDGCTRYHWTGNINIISDSNNHFFRHHPNYRSHAVRSIEKVTSEDDPNRVDQTPERDLSCQCIRLMDCENLSYCTCSPPRTLGGSSTLSHTLALRHSVDNHKGASKEMSNASGMLACEHRGLVGSAISHLCHERSAPSQVIPSPKLLQQALFKLTSLLLNHWLIDVINL